MAYEDRLEGWLQKTVNKETKEEKNVPNIPTTSYRESLMKNWNSYFTNGNKIDYVMSIGKEHRHFDMDCREQFYEERDCVVKRVVPKFKKIM